MIMLPSSQSDKYKFVSRLWVYGNTVNIVKCYCWWLSSPLPIISWNESKIGPEFCRIYWICCSFMKTRSFWIIYRLHLDLLQDIQLKHTVFIPNSNSAPSSNGLPHTSIPPPPPHICLSSHILLLYFKQHISETSSLPLIRCETNFQFGQIGESKRQILRIRKAALCYDDLISQLNVPKGPGFML